ncbi:phytanoyl-CoA dioxygenase family protein [Desertivirga arenae]|uniref:phytanoyl-CoA dioxygenase family protein n=1 Tax=Desertivirga arenae TaxID=2810309 RepID=UPI001A95FA13|nr:phytanoyl-CoA dioxygenase family protein [Pedobacter sp. SYSU D00823]
MKTNHNGYWGPFGLLNELETKLIIDQFGNFSDRLLPWLKGRHTVNPLIAEIACHPIIVEQLKAILGDDVLLSGCQIIKQAPQKNLSWHVDLEHAQWEGLSVWVALENVIPGKSMSLIARSQNFGATPEDFKLQGKDLSSPGKVLDLAKELDPEATLVELHITDGQFFIFDGKLWHATQNPSDSPRYALLLQYCRPDQKVKAVLDINYPQIRFHSFKPECLLISGSDQYGVNRVITRKQVGTPVRKVKAALWYAPRTIAYKALRKVRRRFLRWS